MYEDEETLDVPAAEAAGRFAELLRRVEAGEAITILDAAGRPLALLSEHSKRPASEEELARRQAAVTAAVERVFGELAAEQQRFAALRFPSSGQSAA